MINRSSHKNYFAAALISGCFFMFGCENDINEIKQLGAKKPSIEEGKKIESYLSTDGKVRAKLTAPILLRYQGDSTRKSEFPQSLHVDFYNDSLKVESQLSAKYGNYIEGENKVFLRDSVVVFNIKGDTLFTEELYWDQTQNLLYTDKQVVISQKNPRQKIIGLKGMKCRQDMSDMTIYELRPGSFLIVPDSTTTRRDSIATPAPAPAKTH